MTGPQATSDVFSDLVDAERMKAMQLVSLHEPGGWFRTTGAVTSFYSGAGTITANGLTLGKGGGNSEQTLTDLGAAFASVSAPWAVQVRGLPDPTVRHIARSLGRADEGRIPTMAIRLNGVDFGADVTDGFTVETVLPSEADELAKATSSSFEMEYAGPHGFGSPDLLRDPNVTALWAKTLEGVPVSVGVSIVTSNLAAGLFAIATMPEYRGHGLASAVTRGLLLDAQRRGASISYLQASPMGVPVYAKLGFQTTEELTYFA